MRAAPLQLERSDRLVGRARLRLPAAAEPQRVTNALREALRLASLPGENEGRVYYFRRLTLRQLPADGFRQVWLERVQAALLALAAAAPHAASPSAAAGEAVWFRNRHEAGEILLVRLLRRRPCGEWFWALASPAPPDASREQAIERVVEHLRSTEAGWLPVARTLFAALAAEEVEALLDALAPRTARRWLAELGAQPVPGGPAPLPIATPAVFVTLRRALERFTADDPRTVWLAALAVILAAPAEMASGRAVALARAVLASPPVRPAAARVPSALAPPAVPPGDDPAPLPAATPAAEPAAPQIPASPAIAAAAPLPIAALRPAALSESAPAPAPAPETGRTQAAGLYFLLNALDRLGISATLDPPLAARLLERLANDCAVPAHDPIRAWIDRELPELPYTRAVRLHRVALRRWCRRVARIPLDEIVRRPGLVSLTRTDLDISLPLRAVDLRIRRAGLDLDPGWLPWFGCVVRFHYLADGEFDA